MNLIKKCTALLLLLFPLLVSAADKDKIIMGWMEAAGLPDWDVLVKAKLDTGAKTCSLDAHDIETFSKAGTEWVRFTLDLPKGKANKELKVKVERPVIRYAAIKSHTTKNQKRPVVSLPITLGGKNYQPEFTLTDRSSFLNPILLGRDFLQNVALIDPDHRFLLGVPEGIDKYAKRKK
ncbi:MAG TPA: RimK/LysX family protein [Pseudomonadales bacterium]|nr:RimK/LysX family protein [Pseudomonadales bacterium]